MCAKARSARARKDKKILFSNEFYSDMEQEDMLFAALVRSPYPSGTISSIGLPDMGEGYSFFSWDDIPEKKNVKTLGVETGIFCNRTIAYRGEPVGLLTGPDEQQVAEFAARVAIILEKPDSDEEEESPVPAEKAGSPAETVAFERTVRYGAEDDQTFEALFTGAQHQIDGVWNSTLHPLSYGEPNGAFAYVKGSSLYIFTSTQWLSQLRRTVSEVTGIAPEKIIITKTPVSDLNTNVLWRNSILAAQVAVAACRTGKAVKLVLNREEQDRYMDNTAPVSVIYRTAVAKSGEIIALDATIDVDIGSKNPFAKEIVDRLVIASCSIYRPKNLRIRAQAHFSHRAPFSINLSTIDSQVFFAIENQMQRISEKTGFTPLELRLANYRETNLKKHDSYPFLFSCSKVKDTMEAVCRASDFLRKYTAYKLDEGDRYGEKSATASPYAPPLRGIALACAFQGSGYLGTNFSVKNTSLEATLEKDGSLTVHALPPSPAVWNVWKRAAKELLDIEENKVILDSNFALGTEPDAPDTLSTNVGIYTDLFLKCCKALKSKQGGELPVTVKKMLGASVKSRWNRESFSGSPFYKTAFAAAVVELELDPATYREHLRGIWIVVNGGRILDVRAAEGAIKNGVQQMLSAIIEDDPIAYTNVKLQFVLSNDEPAPIGDIVASVIPAAFSAALSQALASTITSLPIKTDTMYIISEQAQRALSEILAAQKAEHEKQEAREAVEAAEKAAEQALLQEELAEQEAAKPDEAEMPKDNNEAYLEPMTADGEPEEKV